MGSNLTITVQRAYEGRIPVVFEVRHATPLSVDRLPRRVEGFIDKTPIELYEELKRISNALLYGQILGHCIFNGHLRDTFISARSASDGLLRVTFFVEEPGLNGLRWERLAAPGDDGMFRPLGLDQRTPFVQHRSSSSDRRYRPLGRNDLKALVLAASPVDGNEYQWPPFDVARAVAMAREGLGDIPTTVLAALDGADGPPSLGELCDRLARGGTTLLHLVCHGQTKTDGGDARILLEDHARRADPVTAEALVERLGQLADLPHLIVLASCESGRPTDGAAKGSLAASLVHALGTPAVLAMTEPVSVETALHVSTVFYRQLREHGEVERALSDACGRLAGQPDALVPALLSRLSGQPLVSDDPDRPLSPEEIRRGLDRLHALLPDRAPVLIGSFEEAASIVRRHLPLSDEELAQAARTERRSALQIVEALGERATDLSFSALARGRPLSAFDARCPFPGLCAFDEQDRAFFFGREPFEETLVQRLEQHPFLAVLGASGSGKSSLVRAGLIPRLRLHDPSVTVQVMTPGSGPSDALLKALDPEAAVKGARFVVLDQFEEVFTHWSESRRGPILDRLLALPGPGCGLVIAMRADFLGECARHAGLRQAVSQHQELVPPLSARELRVAMEQQAAAVGLEFEADLCATILDDAASEPGAMPLVQHALRQLWQRREGRRLLTAAYRDLGGVGKAIAVTAEAIVADPRLDPVDQRRLRYLFSRLVRPDEDPDPRGLRRDSRCRRRLEDLVPAGEDPASIKALVHRLAGERLLVTSLDATGGEQVEVAHEALLRAWPRLHGWIEADRTALLVREGVGHADREWRKASCTDDFLLHRGSRLRAALDLPSASGLSYNASEQRYLDRCQAVEEADRRRELEAARRTRDALRLAQARTCLPDEATSAALLLAEVEEPSDLPLFRSLSIQALGQPRALAMLPPTHGPLREALSRGGDHVLVRNGDALELRRLDGRGPARRILDDFKLADRVMFVAGGPTPLPGWLGEAIPMEPHRGHEGEQLVLLPEGCTPLHAILPDGRRILGRLRESQALLVSDGGPELDLDLRLPGADPDRPDEPIRVLVVLDQLLSWSPRGGAALWRLDAEAPPQILVGPMADEQAPIASVAWGGRRILVGFSDGGVRIFERGSGPFRPIRTLALRPGGGQLDSLTIAQHEDFLLACVLWPDKRRYAIFTSFEWISTIDIDENATLRTLDGGGVYSLAVSGAGPCFAVGHTDGSVRGYRVSEGRPRLEWTWPGGGEPLRDLVYSPDGDLLAALVGERDAVLWSSSGERLYRLSSTGSKAYGLGFSPDGARLILEQGNRTTVWPTHEGARSCAFRASPSGRGLFAVSPDGCWVASMDEHGQLRLTSTDGCLERRLSMGQGLPVRLAFSPDGGLCAAAASDGTLRLVSVEGGEARRLRVPADPAPVVGPGGFGPDCSLPEIAFDAQGTRLSWMLPDGRACVFRLSDGEPLAVFSDPGGLSAQAPRPEPEAAPVGARRCSLSPDGEHLVLVQPDGSAQLLSVEDPGKLPLDILPAGPLPGLVFSPDSRWLAAYRPGQTLRPSLFPLAEPSVPLVLNPALSTTYTRFEFSSDSRMLMAASLGEATVIDLSCDELPMLPGGQVPFGVLRDAAISPDGSWVLLVLDHPDDPAVLLERSDGLGNPRRLPGPALRPVAGSAGFSPDGLTAFVFDSERLVLWSVEHPTQATVLPPGEGAAFSSVRFSLDSRTLIALCEAQDGLPFAQVFPWDPALLHERLQQSTTVTLSPSQRQELLAEDEVMARTRFREAEARHGR